VLPGLFDARLHCERGDSNGATVTQGGQGSYFFVPVDAGDFPGLSLVITPLPNGRVLLFDPSERVVIVPEPNARLVPVTVGPLLPRSVLMYPLPNGRVCVVVPFDHRVIDPEPNFCVVPVMTLPLLSRSVVIEPLPNGRVVLLEPSERLVMVPDPKACVVPVRDLLIEPLGGSTARVSLDTSTIPSVAARSKRILPMVHSSAGHSVGN
jgi:hypothetical protein